jgi:REP element-mobilizing transposase RayT
VREIEMSEQAKQRQEYAGGSPPAGLSGRGVRLPRLQPLYTARNLHPAYSLRYDWTGWPTEGTALPPATADVARANAPTWEPDGLRLIEAHATADKVQLLFSATPQVSPVFCCQRAKGRLQHALRKAGTPVDFSRKVSFRGLGENTTSDVEGYVRKQVGKERFADPRFEAIMRQFTVTCAEVDLAEPSASASGRYWYNLHVVLVVADRFRITNPEKLGQLRDAAFAVADETASRIAAISVMPDHVHMAVRGNNERSPEQIALAFQNGLARVAGCRAWQDGYYAGTFSEYDLDVIRRTADRGIPNVTGGFIPPEQRDRAM